jgi:hypothetical protein
VSTSSGAVAARDIGWMRACELYACFLPGDPTTGWSLRTDGTCVELGWASALGKPIVIVRDAAVEYSHLIAGLHAVAQVHYIDYGAVAREPQTLVSAIRGALGRPSVDDRQDDRQEAAQSVQARPRAAGRSPRQAPRFTRGDARITPSGACVRRATRSGGKVPVVVLDTRSRRSARCDRSHGGGEFRAARFLRFRAARP